MIQRPHMRKVRAKNTTPELKLRRLLCEIGQNRYCLHYKKLPGKPDVALPSRQKVIFIHGCFWHGHNCKAGKNIPATNTGYWIPKLQGNKKRNNEHVKQIRKAGWEVLIIWECQLKNPEIITKKLAKFLG